MIQCFCRLLHLGSPIVNVNLISSFHKPKQFNIFPALWEQRNTIYMWVWTVWFILTFYHVNTPSLCTLCTWYTNNIALVYFIQFHFLWQNDGSVIGERITCDRCFQHIKVQMSQDQKSMLMNTRQSHPQDPQQPVDSVDSEWSDSSSSSSLSDSVR